MDYTLLSGAVDWGTMLNALGVVALAYAGVHVATKGAGMLLNFVRSGR
ncbi:MAG: hypothetical protein RPT95_13610 [Candidatus Sedimenticola sp. (ex Thyasira tokunagai)]